MKKTHNSMLVAISSLITLLPMIVGFIFWNSLPEKLPIRFHFSGEAYDYANKLFVIAGLPLFLLAMHLLVAFATKPQSEDATSFISNKVYLILLSLVPLVSVFCTVMIFSETLQLKLDLFTVIQAFFAALYFVVGNYLPKIRRNQFVGTKLPWTCKSDYNWDKTNRLTGWLFFIFGFIFLINIFVKVNGWYIIGLALVAVTVIPIIYSYVLSKKEPSC